MNDGCRVENTFFFFLLRSMFSFSFDEKRRSAVVLLIDSGMDCCNR